MRRLAPLAAVVCAVALVGIATAEASTTKTVVAASNSLVGQIIVAGKNHHTLYGFTKDTPKKSGCYGRCSRTFVPLWAKGKIVAAAHSHINAKHLGKIRRKNGSYQVTYYGQPLYTYKAETKPHQLKSHLKQHFGGEWYAILAVGSPAPPQHY